MNLHPLSRFVKYEYKARTPKTPTKEVNTEEDATNVEGIITELICEQSGLSRYELLEKTRKRHIVSFRQLWIWLMYGVNEKRVLNHIHIYEQKWELVRIGYKAQGLDHSTIIHSCKSVSNRLYTDFDFIDMVDEMLEKIGGKRKEVNVWNGKYNICQINFDKVLD